MTKEEMRALLGKAMDIFDKEAPGATIGVVVILTDGSAYEMCTNLKTEFLAEACQQAANRARSSAPQPS
jgi:hypothetical protein